MHDSAPDINVSSFGAQLSNNYTFQKRQEERKYLKQAICLSRESNEYTNSVRQNKHLPVTRRAQMLNCPRLAISQMQVNF